MTAISSLSTLTIYPQYSAACPFCGRQEPHLQCDPNNVDLWHEILILDSCQPDPPLIGTPTWLVRKGLLSPLVMAMLNFYNKTIL